MFTRELWRGSEGSEKNNKNMFVILMASSRFRYSRHVSSLGTAWTLQSELSETGSVLRSGSTPTCSRTSNNYLMSYINPSVWIHLFQIGRGYGAVEYYRMFDILKVLDLVPFSKCSPLCHVPGG